MIETKRLKIYTASREQMEEFIAVQSINCVTAETDRENTASVRVLEKAGFEPTGRFGEEGPVFIRKNKVGKNVVY